MSMDIAEQRPLVLDEARYGRETIDLIALATEDPERLGAGGERLGGRRD